MKRLLMSLKKYNPTSEKREKAKNEVEKNAEELCDIRNKIIRAFEDGTFPLSKANLYKKKKKKKKTENKQFLIG